MTGNVHVWIVWDALRFVIAKGNSRERKAFQAWETAYGGGDLASTSPAQTRIVDVIGLESRYTDYYHDLAIYLESFAGGWQDNITEYDGHIFTALNHFLAVPWYPTCWWRTNGYHYFWSSRTGNDARAMTGKVDNKDAEVDNDHSPIVPRCSFGWTESNSNWSSNWESDIRYTIFVPVNILAYYYYYRLLYRYFTHVDVNGVRYDRINGMYLLGPVCHAVADACVPQHAITTMDLKHQEWENMVNTWASAYELEDFNLVRNLLDTHMRRYYYTSGDLKNMLAIDYLVSELCGWKTYVGFLQQNGLDDIDAMKDTTFWKNYISNTAKVKKDAKLYYNLALAATVRVITEACYDVITTGGGTSSTPVINGVSSYQLVGRIPERKSRVDGEIDLRTRPKLHYVRARNLLGVRVDQWRSATNALYTTRELLYRRSRDRIAGRDIAVALRRLEDEWFLHYKMARAEGVQGFQPAETLPFPLYAERLRKDCGLPNVSKDLETSPNFGLATFRSPTEDELEDPQKFSVYLKASEENTVNAKLLSVTRCVALHKFLLEETANRTRRRKIGQTIETLERLRQFIIRTKRLPAERWPRSRIEPRTVALDAARPVENVAVD